ncbi:MAG: sugar ABC transporter ATP-binding protein [Actinobacteria bacterium]|nr:sugar ABC transporter ATP-binding protein [Actinomycetota bacterium]
MSLSQTSKTHLRVTGASKAFGQTQALDEVDLEVAGGEVHALLGSNGSGKSTLIKILAGVYTADAGTLEINGAELDLRDHVPADVREMGLHFVHQQSSVFPTLSVAENLELGRDAARRPLTRVSPSTVRREAVRTLERFGIDVDPDAPIQDLPLASQTMVAIARTLQDEEGLSRRVLILDEPTASLEADEVRMLFDALRRYAAEGQTIIFVTHQLEEVIELAGRATIFRDGRNAGVLARADFSEAALGELIVGRPLEAYFPTPIEQRDDLAVLELSGVCADGIDGVDLKVHKGEVVGLAGLAGSGHAELLRVIFGLEPLEAGEISLAGKPLAGLTPKAAIAAGLAYVPADRLTDGIFPELSVRENLSMASMGRYGRWFGIDRRTERGEAQEDIDQLGIRTSSQAAPISSLSGGNQQKVVVGRWLRRDPRVLLLEDPTQGIDIGARADLWKAIDGAVEGQMGVLLTSSDYEELARVCNRILVFQSGRVTSEVAADSVSGQDLIELTHTPATEVES